MSPARIPAAHPSAATALLANLVQFGAAIIVPVHVLGAMNLVFGGPTVTRLTVWLSVALGLAISYLLSPFRIVPFGRFRLRPFLWAPAAVIALTYAAFGLEMLSAYPSGFDPINYHLYAPLKWLQKGSLRMSPWEGWQFGLPANAEIPALLALSAGVESLVTAGNILALAVAGLSIYVIARKLSAGPDAAICAVLVFLSVPMVLFQSVTLYVDLYGTAFLMAGIALFLEKDAGGSKLLFLSACACGLAMGTKPVFWPYCFLFTVVAVSSLALQKCGLLPRLALVFAGILLPSAFWFVRAAAASGNPLFPMQVKIAGQVLLPGFERKDITWPGYGLPDGRSVLLHPWREQIQRRRGDLPIGEDRGLGPLFAAFAVPGLLLAGWSAVRDGITKRLSLTVVLVLASAIAASVWFASMFRVPRFAMPLIALACILSARVFDLLLPRYARIVTVIATVGLAVNFAFCLVLPVDRVLTRTLMRDWSRSTFYGYPPVIDSFPPGTRLADRTGLGLRFALTGKRLANYVVTERRTWNSNPDPLNEEFLYRNRVDYVIKSSALDQEDALMTAIGARIVYQGTPPTLAGNAMPWRIYHVLGH